MTAPKITMNLTDEQTIFVGNAVADVWSRKADKVEKTYDNCIIVVYRLLMIIRVDIKLLGPQI